MSTVGQREKNTQQRVLKLLRDTLGYDYLGNWEDREGVDGKGNRNIEPALRLSWRSVVQELLTGRTRLA